MFQFWLLLSNVLDFQRGRADKFSSERNYYKQNVNFVSWIQILDYTLHVNKRNLHIWRHLFLIKRGEIPVF